LDGGKPACGHIGVWQSAERFLYSYAGRPRVRSSTGVVGVDLRLPRDRPILDGGCRTEGDERSEDEHQDAHDDVVHVSRFPKAGPSSPSASGQY